MLRYLVLLSFLISIKTNAQIKISGKITDNHNKVLPGISVSILNSYDGATSDSLGNYQFTTSEKGHQILSASSTGYKAFVQNVDLEGTSLLINISLKEEITELKAVVITAGAFEASDQKRATALSPLDIVTTASANGDITNAIKTLPGTQQVGESEGLFVRGGTAAETKIFIDGTLVNKFFYSSEPDLATRGRFNPFLFQGTLFSSGGYSALYGQALSSVLLLESIDLPEKTSADVGISYLALNAGIQKLSKNKKSSWGITYAYTNLSLVYNLIKQKLDYFRVPILNEGDANFRIKTSKTGMLKYFGQFSTTNVGFRNQDVDSLTMKNAFSLKNFYMYHNLSWKEKIGHGWKLNANQFKYLNDAIVFEKRLINISAIRFGAEYNYSNEKGDYTQYDGITYSQTIKENIFSGFAETNIYLTNDIALQAGVRTEHSKLLNKWDVAPRISMAYKFPDKSEFSLAYGIFYQDPESKYLPSINQLHFAQATHYIAQYQKISNQRTFRTEIFYKKYKDLFKTGFGNGTFKAINNDGFGDAKGIEFFWRDKKTIRNVDYWVSYSYLDTKRDFLNYPFAIEPSFATKHTASLVVKKFVTNIKTQFNASYTFATGRPYYNINYDHNTNAYKIYDQGYTKNYNDLSLSVNYLPSIGKTNAKSFTVFVLSLTNVLGFNKVYTYNYSTNNQNKVAVTPPAKRFLYLGCFISFGIDRSQDEINNHL